MAQVGLLLSVCLLNALFGNAATCRQSAPLGLITGAVQDWQISASSSYPVTLERNCHERFARLYQPNNYAWCAKFKSNSEWLQVDLGVETLVTAAAVQGRCNGKEWVSALMLSYSQDSLNWKFVVDENAAQRVFEANHDSFAVKYLYLDTPFSARFVKFHVVRWNQHPSMRVELFGCQTCRVLIGYPPFGRISASSEQASTKSCSANDGTILSNRAWCAQLVTANQDHWLQFDVGPPTRITGVITKGRGDTKKKHWVTKYRVTYSNDTVTWTAYRDSPLLTVKVFAGNVDKDTERFHYLNQPFVARFVRVHPISWHGHVSMRAGVLGCPVVSDCGPGFFRLSPTSPCIANLAHEREASALSLRSAAQQLRRVSRENSRSNLIARVGSPERSANATTTTPLQHCTTLQTYDSSLLWTVSLPHSMSLRGVVITLPHIGNGTEVATVSSLKVSVSENAAGNSTNAIGLWKSGSKLCASSTLYGQLAQNSVLMQCKRELVGKHVFLEVSASSKLPRKAFYFTLCDLLVF